MWKVPRIWEGEDCIIIGGGPSLTKQFHIPDSLVKDVYAGKSSPSVYSPYMTKIHSMHVIAVNMAYKIGDWMDVLFFGDVGLIEKSHTDIFSFQGLRITCGETKVDYNGRIKLIGKDKAKKLGISFNPSHVAWNFNSGAAAINLAVHFGVKRIILLGFDMKLDEGNQHWHKYYAGNPRTVHATMNTHMRGFPQIAKDLEGKVEIINACPDSRIDAFPKMNLDDIIFSKKVYSENVFTDIYTNHTWGSSETPSGIGSELGSTVNIRRKIPQVFEKYGIKRVLDIGCGDVNWMRELFPLFDFYLGVDVVKPLIEGNKAFETDKIKFQHGWIEDLNLSSYRFDVVILSDVLVHMSYDDINRVIAKLRQSNIQYILMTHFLDQKSNKDIVTGGWRSLRWTIDPFNWGEPLEVVLNKSVGEKNSKGKSLSLWKLNS